MKATIPNQQKILDYLIEGYSPKEISNQMESNITCVTEILRVMRREYKCRSNVQLAIKYDRKEIAEFKGLQVYWKLSSRYNIAS